MTEQVMNEGIPLQFRGGPRAENDQYTGYPREITIDTDFKTIHVHDGTTAGGFPLLRADLENLVSRFTADKIAIELGEAENMQQAFQLLLLNTQELDKKIESVGNDTNKKVEEIKNNVANIKIPAASINSAGISKLNNTVTSTSVSEAATPSAVKQAYDLAAQANNKAPGFATFGVAGNGYFIHPPAENGLRMTIQWGVGTVFPIAFPNACLHVLAVYTSISGSPYDMSALFRVNSMTKTGFSITTTANGSGSAYRWIAIGY